MDVAYNQLLIMFRKRRIRKIRYSHGIQSQTYIPPKKKTKKKRFTKVLYGKINDKTEIKKIIEEKSVSYFAECDVKYRIKLYIHVRIISCVYRCEVRIRK